MTAPKEVGGAGDKRPMTLFDAVEQAKEELGSNADSQDLLRRAMELVDQRIAFLDLARKRASR